MKDRASAYCHSCDEQTRQIDDGQEWRCMMCNNATWSKTDCGPVRADKQ